MTQYFNHINLCWNSSSALAMSAAAAGLARRLGARLLTLAEQVRRWPRLSTAPVLPCPCPSPRSVAGMPDSFTAAALVPRRPSRSAAARARAQHQCCPAHSRRLGPSPPWCAAARAGQAGPPPTLVMFLRFALLWEPLHRHFVCVAIIEEMKPMS
jgi:hypothetical protein